VPKWSRHNNAYVSQLYKHMVWTADLLVRTEAGGLSRRHCSATDSKKGFLLQRKTVHFTSTLMVCQICDFVVQVLSSLPTIHIQHASGMLRMTRIQFEWHCVLCLVLGILSVALPLPTGMVLHEKYCPP
jgi:hypothetical protein